MLTQPQVATAAIAHHPNETVSAFAVTGENTEKDYDADEQRWSALMAAAQEGDQTGYQQLLRELSQAVQRYLVSRLGYHAFIEDCVQDILLAIHNARHTYQPDRPFRPWLFAIVRNKSIDMLRKRKSYEKMLLSQADESQLSYEAALAQTGSSMEESVGQGRLIEALDPGYRQAIVLTKLIGFSNAEAARVMSISETAVKVRVHRGIAKLRSLLEADEA